MTPFCDWLDVTFGPNDCPYPELNRMLLSAGFEVLQADGGFYRYAVSTPDPSARGSLVIELRSRWARVSASGGVCAFLRSSGLWMDYLSALSSSPHKVSRLDAALDLAMDGADLVDSMRRRYASGSVSLGRKAIPTSVMLSVRPDGRETGTWYAGQRTRARVTARVYDKAQQMLAKHGCLVPPTGRVEVTLREGVTLRDAAEPTACFWYVAASTLLKAPEGIPMWKPNTDLGWTAPVREFDAAAVLRRRVDALAELDALAMVADDLGPGGRAYLAGLLEKRLRASLVPSDASRTA